MTNWKGAYAGAYRRGYQAQRDGLTLDDCPYRDIRNATNNATYSAAWRAAWRDGFLMAAAEERASRVRID